MLKYVFTEKKALPNFMFGVTCSREMLVKEIVLIFQSFYNTFSNFSFLWYFATAHVLQNRTYCIDFTILHQEEEKNCKKNSHQR